MKLLDLLDSKNYRMSEFDQINLDYYYPVSVFTNQKIQKIKQTYSNVFLYMIYFLIVFVFLSIGTIFINPIIFILLFSIGIGCLIYIQEPNRFMKLISLYFKSQLKGLFKYKLNVINFCELLYTNQPILDENYKNVMDFYQKMPTSYYNKIRDIYSLTGNIDFMETLNWKDKFKEIARVEKVKASDEYVEDFQKRLGKFIQFIIYVIFAAVFICVFYYFLAGMFESLISKIGGGGQQLDFLTGFQFDKNNIYNFVGLFSVIFLIISTMAVKK